MTRDELRAVIYCRISLDATGEGLGVARQAEACRELCERRGWHVILDPIVDNSVSATKGERPGWTEVLGMIERREVDVVVAWSVDRMYRQPRELEDLCDLTDGTGVIFASVSGDIDLSTPDGRMIARITGGINKGEMEKKSARQKLAHKQRRAHGKPFWSTRPYGYEKDTTIRQEEAERLRSAYRRLLEGAPLAHIANDWNAEGSRTTKGNLWNGTTLRQTVMHARNAALMTESRRAAGKASQRDVVGKGSWDPIVDEETYRAVVRLLDSPTRKNGGSGHRKGLLVGIARCGKCQATVRQGQSRPKADGSKYRLYICTKSQCVTHPADEVDARVVDYLLGMSPAALWKVLHPAESKTVDVDALHERRTVLKSGRQAAADDHYAGLIDRETFTNSVAKIDAQIAEIDTELAGAMTGTAVTGVDLARLREVWDDLPDERRRALIERVFAGIWLKPRGKGRRGVYAADVPMMVKGGALPYDVMLPDGSIATDEQIEAMDERAERGHYPELDSWVERGESA